jgi:hypothetical protein
MNSFEDTKRWVIEQLRADSKRDLEYLMKAYCTHCRKEGHWISSCPNVNPSHSSPRVETHPVVAPFRPRKPMIPPLIASVARAAPPARGTAPSSPAISAASSSLPTQPQSAAQPRDHSADTDHRSKPSSPPVTKTASRKSRKPVTETHDDPSATKTTPVTKTGKHKGGRPRKERTLSTAERSRAYRARKSKKGGNSEKG